MRSCMAIDFYTPTLPHYSAADFSKVDRLMVTCYGVSVLQLMEVAGLRLAEFILRFVDRNSQILLCCGKGNNAGDAMVAARYLKHWGYKPVLLLVADKKDLSPLPAQQLLSAKAFAVDIEIYMPESITKMLRQLQKKDLLVDALFGCGLHAAPGGVYADVIRQINAVGLHVPVLAVDLPSGMDATTGECYDPFIVAHYILTFAAPKLAFKQGLDAEIFVADIGIDMALICDE
eukprot:COSAG01_NODE_412_length_17370_cov_26.910196_16_plen_232_part_00